MVMRPLRQRTATWLIRQRGSLDWRLGAAVFLALLTCRMAITSAQQAEQASPAADPPSTPNAAGEKPPDGADAAPADAADREGEETHPGQRPADRERRVGRLIRISGTIDDKVDDAVHRQVDVAIKEAKNRSMWPVLIFEIHPGHTDIFHAQKLALFLSGPALSGATTVAYLPKSITGHAVLVAMACDEIIMGENAEIGNASEQKPGNMQPIAKRDRDAYIEIGGRKATIPVDLAIGMVDPDVEVVLVEVEDGNRYVLRSAIDELRKVHAVVERKVVKPKGEIAMFTAPEARNDLGFVTYLANDRGDVAQSLGLPREAVEDDPSLGGQWRAARIDVHGPISAETANQVQSMITKQIQERDTNLICLWIDSPGGSPTDSLNLANFLAGQDSSKRRTVAYIPAQARGDAAIVALACDHIVMHPDAVLGGPGAYQAGDEELPLLISGVEDLANRKMRSKALAVALVDPKVSVHPYRRTSDGLIEYLTPAQADDLPDKDLWKQEPQIKGPGGVLRVNGSRALELGMGHGVASDFQEFKAMYGLEDDPMLAEPGWADHLVEALSSPSLAWILLFIGGIAIWTELQSPGIGIGGLIAGVCFALYFWSAFLGGTAGWLEIVLFLTGAFFLALEIFILPGFGIFGLGGGVLILSSLILASQTFILPRNEYQLAQLTKGLLMVFGAGAGTVVAALLLRRVLPHTPMFSRVLLAPPSSEEVDAISRREALTRFEHLVGGRGTTVTPLVPGGKVRFGDELVDVISYGEFIDRGKPVTVIEVRGNRVVVREIA